LLLRRADSWGRLANKCFLCESEATATDVFCAKAKRQQQRFICAKAIATATTKAEEAARCYKMPIADNNMKIADKMPNIADNNMKIADN